MTLTAFIVVSRTKRLGDYLNQREIINMEMEKHVS
jgi:hypothetical protein